MAVDLVTEMRARVASNPTGGGAVQALLAQAAAEIERLRGVYEKDGVVDPWTGAWCADGKVSAPVATLDADGRVVTTGATHAQDVGGVVRPVQAAAPKQVLRDAPEPTRGVGVRDGEAPRPKH